MKNVLELLYVSVSFHLYIFFLSIFHRPTILQQQFNRAGRVEHGSVALPGILRSGSVGPEELNMGTMPSPQQQITTGLISLGHMPPLVSLYMQMLTFIEHLVNSAKLINCPLLAIGHLAV